ncbi:Methylthioadenosine phosphorylase [Pyrrhoderma noxium]|uniref:Methylthioadenosine phosphorylase n=1 Tax=Pyrrhoderma noxium TaxID=2282107 RepID=A0A286UM42_9AGAM|nr:Methylthioadenosine phosphorylase [Pyrrhoderma noxium]
MPLETSTEKILIGVIGGSGLYNLDNLTFVKHVNPETPWGKPSSPITIARAPGGTLVAFLARHGIGHSINPSAVPARANIAALKSLGVKLIVAFSAVGSLREEIKPGDFVLPDQIIDRTKGIRPASFFEGTNVVAHAQFGDPFANKLLKYLEGHFVWRALNSQLAQKAKCIVPGGRSNQYEPTATDYDSWRESSEPVTAAEVFKTLQSNADTSRRVTELIVADLHEAAENGDLLSEEAGSMQFSIMPRTQKAKDEDIEKLSFILPQYFSS